MTALPPLELHAEIETADGLSEYRWDGQARDPSDRPQNITCGSTLMNGYATGGASLARDINRDFPDLGLYDTIRFVGVDGQIAYEGRGSRFPREASTQHRINAETVGWMAHARDKAIVFLGVDRDLSHWHEMTAPRQAALQALGYAIRGAGERLSQALSLGFIGPWPAGEIARVETWYDAGPGSLIGSIDWSLAAGANVDTGDVNWVFALRTTTDTIDSAGTGGSLQGGPTSGTHNATAGQRYAFVDLTFATAGGGEGIQYNVDFTNLSVRGAHGLPTVGTFPYGLLGSDIIKYTAGLAAPLLDTSGVLATSHPIAQFAFPDLTDPYDMWLAANQYERWNLAVWDNKLLVYAPLPDPTTVQTTDWVLRSSDRNNLRRGYDGPTTDGSKNGVSVRFQNVITGQADMIDPTTNPELADTNTRLAANRAGIQDWEKIQLPNPNSPAGAAKIGVAALAEFNRRRTPGRFQATGHIPDAAGNPHQGWLVKAGQTVLLEEDADDNDPVRVVHEASWSGDSKTLTINADAAAVTIDAIVADMGL